MKEQRFNRTKKIVTLLVAVFLVSTLTAVSASACDDGNRYWDEDDHTWKGCDDHDDSYDDCDDYGDNYDDCDNYGDYDDYENYGDCDNYDDCDNYGDCDNYDDYC